MICRPPESLVPCCLEHNWTAHSSQLKLCWILSCGWDEPSGFHSSLCFSILDWGMKTHLLTLRERADCGGGSALPPLRLQHLPLCAQHHPQGNESEVPKAERSGWRAWWSSCLGERRLHRRAVSQVWASSGLFHAAPDPLCRRAHDHLLQVLQCSVWTPLEGLGPGGPAAQHLLTSFPRADSQLEGNCGFWASLPVWQKASLLRVARPGGQEMAPIAQAVDEFADVQGELVFGGSGHTKCVLFRVLLSIFPV